MQHDPQGDHGGADGEIGTADDHIQTVAGTGGFGYNGDNRTATSAQLANPRGVAVSYDGGFYIADSLNQRVRRVSPGGTISAVAGTGVSGSNGDGLPATSADWTRLAMWMRHPTVAS
ncbi:MAG: hypothetical protein U0Y82_09670 [Thermoleophilia bacterium]